MKNPNKVDKVESDFTKISLTGPITTIENINQKAIVPVQEQKGNNEFSGEDKEKLENCTKEVLIIKKKYQLTPKLNYLVDKRLRRALNFKIIKNPKRLPDYLNPAEIYIFLNAANKSSFIDAVLAKFLIYTGLRINEANNLKIHHLDIDQLTIKVEQGKGHKDRIVPIKQSLITDLKGLIGKRTNGYIFCKKNETQYTKRALQKKIENILKLCNFAKKLSTHSLRHTFACLMLSKGMRIEEIQLLMGHDSVKTTEIYARLELGQIKDKYLQLMGD